MSEPNPIKKLDEHVINRIAAGEVIQRPANALKEMIENSIDARATIIQVTVKDGGLKLLQITDNGIGIRSDDFPLVCERFATSKLETFEDLNSISTYGFRGEALASISHIAHLTIQSKTAMQDCAYRASYVDSLLKSSPKPCAGNVGTIITVEDLFYNMSTRRKALKNGTEEFRKISEVIGKYSIHNAHVSFSLKKFGDNVTIKTQVNSNPIENIRIIYGNSIAKELINIEFKEDNLKFSASAFATNVNYSTKKGTFILFINDRLVESLILKKSIDQIYNTYLPKNSYPFVYLSIKVDPQNIDVNVHPTKHQVHFLHEEQIAEKISLEIEQQILKSNNSRVFYTQAKLPGASTFKVEISEEKSKIRNDKTYIRTDCTDQKLDKFLCPADDAKNNKMILNMTSISQSTTYQKKETNLSSVVRLRKVIEDNCHISLRELISEHVFVGSIDINRTLIQHNTKLYYCNNQKLLQELFYQILIYNFQNFGTLSFSKPLSVKDLIMIALDLPETGWKPEDGDKSALADCAVKILKDKSALLDDYFSLTIDSDLNLTSIPLLIENYVPEMAGLPTYMLKLATNVNWKREEKCFHTFAKVTARYYARRQELNHVENNNWKWTTEHVLFPTLKKYLMPPKSFTKNAAILQIADLPDLYKVFERC